MLRTSQWSLVRIAMAFFALLSLVLNVEAQTFNALRINTTSDLKNFFRCTQDRIPLVCGHRGGAARGFPENCIVTFENTLRQIPAFFEVDPRLTKDSVVVVMHDATLDRTTTGTGRISDYTWSQLASLRLKDPEGNISSYGISTLSDVLQWARGKTILMLDKKDVPLKLLLKEITRNNAESYVLVSSYKPEEAVYYYGHNHDIMFEAFIFDMETLYAYEKSGIPWENIVAYLGKTENKELYEALHARNVMCINYTAPVIEKIKDKETRVTAYKNLIRSGADILLSDRIIEVARAIEPLKPESSNKSVFFVTKKYAE